MPSLVSNNKAKLGLQPGNQDLTGFNTVELSLLVSQASWVDKQWSSDGNGLPSIGAHPTFLGSTPLLAPFVTYSETSCCWLFTLFSRSTVGAKFNPESSFAISRGISTFRSYFFRVSKIGFAFHDITMNHIPNISPLYPHVCWVTRYSDHRWGTDHV